MNAKQILLLAMFAFTAQGLAATYDLAADFSTTRNPNGAWSYGWSTNRGSTFILCTNSLVTSNSSVYTKGWIPFGGIYGPPTVSPWSPVIDYNDTGEHVPAGTVAFHPGAAGQNSVIRWTAPSAGTYTIRGSFIGRNQTSPTTSDVAILHGTNAIFAGLINNYDVPLNFSLTRDLNAGDAINFTVGYGSNGNWIGDSTGISATIADQDCPPLTLNVSEIQVCWSPVSNRLYQIDYRSTLTTNAWLPLATNLIGNGTTMCVTDRTANPQRYYRIVCSTNQLSP